MRTCENCGTRLSEGMCLNCQEERYIYETQIYPDGTPMELSQNFAGKVNEQKLSKRT